MIFTEIPAVEQEAMAAILGKHTGIKENDFNHMDGEEQGIVKMFCFLIAQISNNRDEIAEKEFAEKFLKQLP